MMLLNIALLMWTWGALRSCWNAEIMQWCEPANLRDLSGTRLAAYYVASCQCAMCNAHFERTFTVTAQAKLKET